MGERRDRSDALRFLDGGGAMGAMMRAHDWSQTSVGTPETWPQPLKTLVGLMLAAKQAMFVAWGAAEQTMLYNDGYARLLGRKHPAALGRSCREVWIEIADDLAPLFAAVYRGDSVHMDDIALVVDRFGSPAEAHFDFSYTPVRDEGGVIAGLFCACREITDRVEQTRASEAQRLRLLELFDNAPSFICSMRGPDHVVEFVNRAHRETFGDRNSVGRPIRATFPEAEGQGFFEMLDGVYATGEEVVAHGVPARLARGAETPPENRIFDFVYAAIRDEDGRIGGVFVEGHDVTARYSAGRALGESEARFRAAFDAIQGVLWTNSAEGEMLGEQPAWAALTGQAQHEYQGYGWADALHPDDARPTIDAWREAVAARRPFLFEHRVRRHDGAWRLCSVRAIPALDAYGAIREWVGVHTDITDRIAAERALAESEEHYRHAAELNPQVAWTATPDGMLDRVAERWYEWTGSSGLGDTWGRGLHSEDLGYTTEAWVHSITTGEPYDVEHRVAMRDGSYHWARSRAWPRRDADGHIIKWYGSTEDIHARKLAEGDFRGVAEALPGFVWTADDQGGIEYTSPPWHAYSGSKPEDSLGAGWASFVHPDDQAGAFALWAHCLNTGEPYEIEFRLRAADGSYHWWMARARRHDEGRVRWIGIATELDQIVAARETLARSQAELEAEVEARTAALRETEEQLRQSQKLEAVGQLTGGVAHDFNNLLTVIRGSTDLLQRPGITEERRTRYIEAISDTVTRATKLTSQLLAFARRQALKPEIFDVGAAVAAIADMVRTLTGERITLDLRAPDAPCHVNADPSQFDTALVNMVVNARDAMDGEGALTIAVGEAQAIPAIRSHPAMEGAFVAIKITDTGAGIDPERIDAIFEPFFTTKAVGHGTGLGLSQVYGFAKQSEGEIRVESSPGAGATFTLYLPRVPAPTSTPPAPEEPTRVEGQGTCVLVVEDNQDVGSFAEATLSELGYSAVLAPDATVALAELARDPKRFDVVFSDVMMPGIDGIELAGRIARDHPGLPVVLTSGYSNALAQQGATGFALLHKPYSMDELSRVLRVAAATRVRALAD